MATTTASDSGGRLAGRATGSSSVSVSGSVSVSRSQVKELGKSILAAAFLGRWEEIFFQASSLTKLLIRLLLRSVRRRKALIEGWLKAPLVSATYIPTWTSLPFGPFVRLSLLLLRKVKRWHILAGKFAVLFCFARSLTLNESVFSPSFVFILLSFMRLPLLPPSLSLSLSLSLCLISRCGKTHTHTTGSGAAAWFAFHSMRTVNVSERLELLRIEKKLKKKVEEAENYSDWSTATSELEKHLGKKEDISTRYDRLRMGEKFLKTTTTLLLY